MGCVVFGILCFGLLIQGYLFPEGVLNVTFPLASGELDVYKDAESGKGPGGASESLPPLWPPDVGPEARTVLKDRGGESALFSTEKPPEQVLGFFRERLAGEGWREVETDSEEQPEPGLRKAPGGELAVFVRGSWRLYVVASREQGRTRCRSLLLGPFGD
jgi:hypothetical protein